MFWHLGIYVYVKGGREWEDTKKRDGVKGPYATRES